MQQEVYSNTIPVFAKTQNGWLEMKILEKNIINCFGENGRAWLDALPVTIEKLSAHWSLTDIKPVNKMSWHYVAFAIQNNKTPVVIKVGCDKKIIQDEYKVLQNFDGHGAIKVIDMNIELNALLLEQALPGCQLKSRDQSQIFDTIRIYSSVVKTLSDCQQNKNNYTHASSWCEAIDKITDTRIEKRFVDQAKKLKSILLHSAKNEYVCHGDLHLENIVQHGTKWVCIDPKGIIGEMAFEAAAFDLLSDDEIKNDSDISSLISDRTMQLADTLNIDLNRLLSWIFLRVIISAQWFIEDNGNPNQMLLLAEKIYPMVQL